MALNGRIFIISDISGFLEDMSRKFKFHQNLTRITGTSQKGLCTFMITSLTSSQNEKRFRRKLERNAIYFMFNNFFFFENRAVYKITWNNKVLPERLQMTI
jgi:hypothetical protein